MNSSSSRIHSLAYPEISDLPGLSAIGTLYRCLCEPPRIDFKTQNRRTRTSSCGFIRRSAPRRLNPRYPHTKSTEWEISDPPSARSGVLSLLDPASVRAPSEPECSPSQPYM